MCECIKKYMQLISTTDTYVLQRKTEIDKLVCIGDRYMDVCDYMNVW